MARKEDTLSKEVEQPKVEQNTLVEDRQDFTEEQPAQEGKQEVEQKELFHNTGVFVITIGDKVLIPKPSKESGLVVDPVELTKEEQAHFEIKHYIEKGILVKA